MQRRPLGNSDVMVSPLSFGAGPVPALMTRADPDASIATVARAVDQGIHWFDTAATYGNGESERTLGHAIAKLGLGSSVNVATKVRLADEDFFDLASAVRSSLHGSLARLGVPKVSLLQIHNSITPRRGDLPTSITPADVLNRGGLLDAMRSLQEEGLVDLLGLTGLGDPESLREVLESRAFATVQIPYHLLNPTAGMDDLASFAEENHGNLLDYCRSHDIAGFAIRVFAGGALVGKPPSAHTFKTKFFPLDLYQRDARRAERIRLVLPRDMSIAEAAVRFSISHPALSSAIVGFSSPEEVDAAVGFARKGPLPDKLLGKIRQFWKQDSSLTPRDNG
ncbi:MAG: aldo/keto reductase [Planctomycetota bacterium]